MYACMYVCMYVCVWCAGMCALVPVCMCVYTCMCMSASVYVGIRMCVYAFMPYLCVPVYVNCVHV